MKKRRRIKQCPNCNTLLNNTDNFCPECGQENHVKTFSLSELWTDFTGSIFNFDGKIFTTLKTIVLRPGKVPKDIIAGKKVRYVPTVRFYFFVSFIYFLILNFGVDLVMKSQGAENIFNKVFDGKIKETIPVETSTYKVYQDSTELALHHLAIIITDSLQNSDLTREDLEYWESHNAYDSIYLDKKLDLFSDTTKNYFSPFELSGSNKRKYLYQIVYALKPTFDSIRLNDLKFSYSDLKTFYNDREKIEPFVKENKENLDHYNKALSINSIELVAVTQYGSLTEKKDYFTSTIKKNLSNFSLALLLIMPLSALILYLFYFYKKPKLVPHIIFTIHFHSVILIFLIVIFAIITGQYVLDIMLPNSMMIILIFIIGLCSLIYFVLAIKRFYNSRWLSAIFKSIIINILYIVLLLLIIGMVFMVSVF